MGWWALLAAAMYGATVAAFTLQFAWLQATTVSHHAVLLWQTLILFITDFEQPLYYTKLAKLAELSGAHI